MAGPRMAWCGGPDSTPGKQVWAAPAQPDPQSCEQAGCPAVPILHREPVRPLPGQGKEPVGGLLPESQGAKNLIINVCPTSTPCTDEGWGGGTVCAHSSTPRHSHKRAEGPGRGAG